MSDRLLDDLPDIIRDVCRGRFSFDLPLVFKGNQMPDDETKGPRNKSKKIEDNVPADDKRVVQNPTPNEEYKLLDGEEFGKVFGGRHNICHRIDWLGGEKMCPRFHSKYYCFNNCRNKESHVPKSQIPSEQDKNYKKILKKMKTRKMTGQTRV